MIMNIFLWITISKYNEIDLIYVPINTILSDTNVNYLTINL